MKAPVIETFEQGMDFVTALEAVSKFGGASVRIHSWLRNGAIDMANRRVTSLWPRLTKKHKQDILTKYTELRLER